MSFTRPIPNANGEWICQRNTELSDVIRARNKREDRLLNVRIKFYERERNIRLNFIRQDQYQLERVRTSICEQANKIQIKRQNPPVWMSPRPKTGVHLRKMIVPEMVFPDWEVNQLEVPPPLPPPPPPPPPPLLITPAKVLRRHSAR